MTYTSLGVPLQNLPQFLWGALATIEMSGVACLLGRLCGWWCSGPPLKEQIFRRAATAYVEIIRNTPFIVQLFYVYFGLVTVGINLEAFSVAIITLTLNCGATARDHPSRIQSIHPRPDGSGSLPGDETLASVPVRDSHAHAARVLAPLAASSSPPCWEAACVGDLGRGTHHAGMMLESAPSEPSRYSSSSPIVYF